MSTRSCLSISLIVDVQVDFHGFWSQIDFQKLSRLISWVVPGPGGIVEIPTLPASLVLPCPPRHPQTHLQPSPLSDTWFSSAVCLKYANGILSP